jgi:acetyl esterase/lipase
MLISVMCMACLRRPKLRCAVNARRRGLVSTGIVCAVGLWMIASSRASGAPPEKVRDDVRLVLNVPYRDGANACLLDLALPKGPPARPRPAVVVIHGGGWIEGDKSSFDVSTTPGNIVDFAAAGFVAAAVNYRLSREAEYPAGLHDCQAAIRWLRRHADEYHLDRARIGAYGNSAGGHLALLLGLLEATSGPREKSPPFANESSRVQAVVSDSGPLDLTVEIKNGTLRGVIEQFMGGPPEGSLLAAYRQASPLFQAGQSVPPLLLIYGEADSQVDVRTADRFVDELSRAGHKDITYFRLANVSHCPHSLVGVPYLRPAVIDFFKRTLSK